MHPDDLPFSKKQRVWFEVFRTIAALTSALVNAVVLLKVFGVL